MENHSYQTHSILWCTTRLYLGTSFNKHTPTCGVPQGSTFGLLLPNTHPPTCDYHTVLHWYFCYQTPTTLWCTTQFYIGTSVTKHPPLCGVPHSSTFGLLLPNTHHPVVYYTVLHWDFCYQTHNNLWCTTQFYIVTFVTKQTPTNLWLLHSSILGLLLSNTQQPVVYHRALPWDFCYQTHNNLWCTTMLFFWASVTKHTTTCGVPQCSIFGLLLSNTHHPAVYHKALSWGFCYETHSKLWCTTRLYLGASVFQLYRTFRSPHTYTWTGWF